MNKMQSMLKELIYYGERIDIDVVYGSGRRASRRRMDTLHPHPEASLI